MFSRELMSEVIIMQSITLKTDEVIRLSNDELDKILKQDSNYRDLKDEEKGRFSCTYLVNNVYVFLYNEVGGIIRSYVSNHDEAARFFAMKSEILVNSKMGGRIS